MVGITTHQVGWIFYFILKIQFGMGKQKKKKFSNSILQNFI